MRSVSSRLTVAVPLTTAETVATETRAASSDMKHRRCRRFARPMSLDALAFSKRFDPVLALSYCAFAEKRKKAAYLLSFDVGEALDLIETFRIAFETVSTDAGKEAVIVMRDDLTKGASGSLPTGQPRPKVLTATAVSKNFGGVSALRDVNFDLSAGEIHALMGENGAGKSTLMKILSGVYSDYDGTIAIDGKASPLRRRARRRGGGHRHHPPGAQPRPAAQRRRQYLPWPRTTDRRPCHRPQGKPRGGALASAKARHRA